MDSILSLPVKQEARAISIEKLATEYNEKFRKKNQEANASFKKLLNDSKFSDALKAYKRVVKGDTHETEKIKLAMTKKL